MIGKIEELYKGSKGFLSVNAKFKENGRTYELTINKEKNDYDLFCEENGYVVYSHKNFKEFIEKIQEGERW